MIRLRLSLAIALFAAASAAATVFAATQEELRNDIAYYRRMADREKMVANDRLYILLRLQEKYLESGVDLAELKSEIASQEAARKPAPPPEAKAKTTPPGPMKPAAGERPVLERIRVEKNDEVVSLVLGLSRGVVPRATRVDDPARPGRPLLLIDLPGTQQRLSAVSRDLRWQEGPLASAVTSETAEGVRVQIELNGEVPYRVLRADRSVVLETRPAAPPWSSPDAAHALKNAGRAPAGRAKAAQDLIGEADVLDVRVEPARELDREADVRADGTIDFPLAGPLFVRGMTAAWVEKNLAQKLEPFVPRPRVTVRIVKEPRPEPAAGAGRGPGSSDGNSVFLIGQVVNPGHYPYAPGTTLLEAVSRAGGVAGAARPGRVKVFRQTSLRREVFDVDLASVLRGDTGKDVALQAGDIVLVPAKPLYGSAGSGWLPWLTLATLVAAVILAV